MIFVLQENYCDALGQVYNETSLREVDINNLLEISIASDIVGGGELKFFPFLIVSNCSLFRSGGLIWLTSMCVTTDLHK